MKVLATVQLFKALLHSIVLISFLAACVQQAALEPLDQRPPVELVVVEQLTPSWAHAQVSSPSRILILQGHENSVTLVAHELCHVVQWTNLGCRFPLEYAAQFAVHGYEDMPLERECRALEDDPWYRDWAGDLIADRWPHDH